MVDGEGIEEAQSEHAHHLAGLATSPSVLLPKKPAFHGQRIMSIVSTKPRVTVIGSVAALTSLLDLMADLSVCPPSLFLDLECTKLGRHGSISIMSLYAAPKDTVYLVDIYRLGRLAFETTNSHETSLKSVLESAAIPKVMFDVRSDSDALFSQYQVSLNGIKDVQRVELASRRGSKTAVTSLATCVEKHSVLSAETKTE